MKKCLIIAAVFFLLLATLEVLATLALFIRPTGNPLAFPSDEASLHIFQPPSQFIPLGVKPNYSQVFRSDEFETTIRTNNLGFRENFDFHGEALDIATVGDSFAFGHGVEVGDRYSDLLRQHFKPAKVMSLAYPNGAEPASYYLFLKYNPRFIPRVLVVGLFAWNDLRDDIASMELSFDTAGELITAKSRAWTVNADGFLVSPEKQGWIEPWWRKQLRCFNSGRVSLILYHRLSRVVSSMMHGKGSQLISKQKAGGRYKSEQISRQIKDDDLDAMARRALGFIENVAQLVKSAGGQTLVIYIPVSYRVGKYPFFCKTISKYSSETCAAFRKTNGLGRSLAKWFVGRHIDFIDPTIPFRRLETSGQRLYFEKDGHWRPTGHRAAAELIARRIREKGYLD